MPAYNTYDNPHRGKPVARKQLYGEITAGVFNSLTLQHIDNELSDISDGKRNFNRLTQEICRGMLCGGKELARASLICRADESSGSTQPRGSYSGEKECGKRQESLIENYANAADCWLDLVNLDPEALIGSGGESEVYRYSDTEVLKVNTTRYTISPQILLDRIAIHNAMFPATKMTVQGFGRNCFGEFCIAYTQPFVEGTKPSQKQIDELLNTIEQGEIKGYSKEGNNYKTDYLLYDDFHEENIIVDKYSGKLMVIDSDIRFNTPSLGLGGKYEIPSVEQDYLIDKIEKKHTMAKDNNENINTANIDGLVYSCDITELGNGKIAAKMVICTATQKKLENGTTTSDNWINHRAVAIAEGEKAEKLRKAQETYKNNMANYGKPGFTPTPVPISIQGPLVLNNNKEPFISVSEDKLEFPKKLKMKNTISIKGEVAETACNEAYATAMLKTASEDGKNIIIPICIYNRDNPRKWADISSGRVKKGDMINVTGPLISRMFNDGQKKMFRCSVNAGNFTVSNKKKTQKETATLGF